VSSRLKATSFPRGFSMIEGSMVPELSSKKYLAVFMVFLIVLAGSLVYFDVRHKVLSLLVWLDTLDPWGPTLFILFDMLVVLFIVSGFGLIMALGAGFIFGVLTGTVYVIVGTTEGAAFAFTIALHFFGERASKFILARSKLKVLEHEFTREGWKIVLLTNLVPFFPFRLSNYFYGLMHFSLGDFIIGVFFGIMTFTITNVYIGSLAANLATLGERNASRSLVGWVMYGLGFMITVGIVVYVSRVARKALDSYVEKEELP
jgi:uncharacterized membrane protein YdjX (TVP38/TMEM64 family)